MPNLSSNKFFNSLSGGLGKVNGQNIEKADFDKKFNYAYELAKQQSAPNRSESEYWPG